MVASCSRYLFILGMESFSICLIAFDSSLLNAVASTFSFIRSTLRATSSAVRFSATGFSPLS
ncbi:hypothetical protein, partial [Bacteroides acidifaciens]|uniref:hypothetical protein n=1 Tax=Bacteroides acidifaciens TaxID=85831 RepID=UPI003014A877